LDDLAHSSVYLTLVAATMLLHEGRVEVMDLLPLYSFRGRSGF
jgi:hypothetical protein